MAQLLPPLQPDPDWFRVAHNRHSGAEAHRKERRHRHTRRVVNRIMADRAMALNIWGLPQWMR